MVRPKAIKQRQRPYTVPSDEVIPYEMSACWECQHDQHRICENRRNNLCSCWRVNHDPALQPMTREELENLEDTDDEEEWEDL